MMELQQQKLFYLFNLPICKKKSLLLYKNKNTDFFIEKEIEQIRLDYFIQENESSKNDFLKISSTKL